MEQTTVKTSKKQVRETAAGKSISAWVILDKYGKYLGKVQAAFLDSGSVMVDVWDNNTLVHQGKAGGYGYDKLTAALSGGYIDGHKFMNHSVGNQTLNQHVIDQPENGAGLSEYWDKLRYTDGVSPSNWKDGKYTSCYFISGLDRLSAMGYQVIQAI